MSKEQIEEMAREMCHLSAECKTCQICNERYHGDDDLCYFQCVAKEIINHGYRKQVEGEWGFDGMSWTCSECGEYATKGIKTTFCPNCGAKMKGENG